MCHCEVLKFTVDGRAGSLGSMRWRIIIDRYMISERETFREIHDELEIHD